MVDYEKDFILETDASDMGLGATLMQEDGETMKPIAYANESA